MSEQPPSVALVALHVECSATVTHPDGTTDGEGADG